jgi:hypothetical protein
MKDYTLQEGELLASFRPDQPSGRGQSASPHGHHLLPTTHQPHSHSPPQQAYYQHYSAPPPPSQQAPHHGRSVSPPVVFNIREQSPPNNFNQR